MPQHIYEDIPQNSYIFYNINLENNLLLILFIKTCHHIGVYITVICLLKYILFLSACFLKSSMFYFKGTEYINKPNKIRDTEIIIKSFSHFDYL